MAEYKCKQCNDSFKTAGELRKHVKYFHEPEKARKELITKLQKSQRISKGNWLWWLIIALVILIVIFFFYYK